MSDIHIINNLKKFGIDFQKKCVSCLLVDKAFLERIYDILDVKYFETESLQWIVKEIIEYFIKYKNLPTGPVFKIRVDSISTDSNFALLRESIVNDLKYAFVKTSDTDLEFIKETFLEFCKNQKLKNAIEESVDLLKQGKYEEIKSKVDVALKAGMYTDMGHDYVSDFKERMEEHARNTIVSGFPLIDGLLDGGLAEGELGVVISSAGGGKTWMLTKIGAEAVKTNKKVLHITLELNEKYVGLRYDSCFTGINFRELRDNKDKIWEIVKQYKGNLKIKKFAVKSVSPQSIKLYVDRLRMFDFNPDLILIDYADLLKTTLVSKNQKSYDDMGNIYEDLRAASDELRIPIWTASQSQRGTIREKVILADGVADSYKKIMVADFVMSFSRRELDKVNNTSRVHIIKNRFGADGMSFVCYFNSSNGDIKIYDENSEQGRKLKEVMDNYDEEKTEKKFLAKKWFNRTIEGETEDDPFN